MEKPLLLVRRTDDVVRGRDGNSIGRQNQAVSLPSASRPNHEHKSSFGLFRKNRNGTSEKLKFMAHYLQFRGGNI